MKTRTDVLIVGAGPTGLALALTLARAGVDFVIVDKRAAEQNTSRAAVIHAHTLDVLDELGVARTLAGLGARLDKFSIRDRDRTLLRLRFGDLPSRHAYLLMLPQDVTEKVLADALAAAGGHVHLGCEVRALQSTADQVQASIATREGAETISARFAVGADGMHSLVRQAAGIEFSGAAGGESFVLADVEMQWGHGRDEVMLYFSPAGLAVVAPLPNGTYRIVATLEQAPEHPGISDVQALLDSRGPTTGIANVSKIVWSSRFRLHHRVASAYRRGRMLLVGDAAHVHSPAGGQGMNTGLVDAYVLGKMLADVLAGRQDETYLDRYEALRRPAAEQVLRLAGRLTRMATMKNPFERRARNVLLGLAGRFHLARRRLAMNLSGLSRAGAATLP